MSRFDLTTFIHSIEHSYELRKKFCNCTDQTEILELAKEYGFTINHDDLTESDKAEKIERWFKQSLISPLKKPRS